MSIPSVLEYARFHGLATDHSSEDLSGYLCHVSRPNKCVREEDFAFPDPDFTAFANALEEPKLHLSREATILLAESITDPRPKIHWEGILPDPHRWSRLRVEEPLLARDHDLDMAAFRQKPAGFSHPGLLLEDTTQFKTAFDDSYKEEWDDILTGRNLKDVQESLNHEKVHATREALMSLSDARDGPLAEDEREDLLNTVVHMKPRLRRPSSPLSMLPEWHTPSPSDSDVDFISEEDQLRSTTLPEKLREVGGSHKGSDTGSPKQKPTNSRPTLSVRGEDALGLGESTPQGDLPEPSVSATRAAAPCEDLGHAAGTCSTAIEPASSSRQKHGLGEKADDSQEQTCPSDRRNETSIPSHRTSLSNHDGRFTQNSDDDIDIELVRLAEQANEKLACRLKQETMSLPEACTKLTVPALEFSLESPATHVSRLDFIARHLGSLPSKEQDSAELYDGVELEAAAIPPHYRNLNRNEKLEECGKLQLLHEAAIPPQGITRSEQMLWKQPGLRILDESDGSDNELEEDASLAALICKPATPKIPLKRFSQEGCSDVSSPTKKLLRTRQDERAGRLGTKCHSSTLPNRFSASSALETFLDLRGSKFKEIKRPLQESMNEIQDDPIEATRLEEDFGDGPAAASTPGGLGEFSDQEDSARILVPSTPILPSRPLEWRRTVVVDMAMLQTCRPVLNYLERQGSNQLTMIYRELSSIQARGGKQRFAGPDMILNPRDGLVFTNLQTLHQKGLPGQGGHASQGMVHSRIMHLLQDYDHVFVLVTITCAQGRVLQTLAETITQFTGLCSSLSSGHSGNVTPVWVLSQRSLQDDDPALNSMTWQLIARHAFPTSLPRRGSTIGPEAATLIHDETLWELFLKKAGMNAMAAQVVLSMLHRSKFSTEDGDQSWGLRRAVVRLSNLAPPFRGVPRTRSTFAFFRYLFPNTHRRAREKLLGVRHEYIPQLRLRAQSRIYQAIVRRQQKKREKREAGKGLVPFLQRRKSRILQVLYGKHHAGSRHLRGPRSIGQMTSYGYGESGARGLGRREKLRGILRAANELRQTYQDQLQHKLQASETDGSMPGEFPDVEIVRSGEEEMILFPTYARKHTKKKTNPDGTPRYPPGTHESVETQHSSGDAEYWKREWEKYEDANAIVDVDVRGWIYSPQRGPLSRRNRLLIAVARRLSGIYAPPAAPTSSRPPSQAPSGREELDDNPSKHEDEIAAREAAAIARRGQLEAEAALRGSYTQPSRRSFETDSQAGSRSSSPAPSATIPTRATEGEEDDPGQRRIQKRQSWNEPANMTREEMVAANEMLMTRLRPFMSTPLANTPITIFFFNDQRSASKSVTTDDSGHFNLRAALDFIPTQVRVLASEKLSATQDVMVTDNRGVSLISDIDDTVKHSGIAAGAREIFKNTFIRELGDLTVEGVKEWYGALARMGVKLHYVSNSPWQLYPLLRSYFYLAGLPPGSFHLKQYSGMLQGIFEPAAERKRGSLERILNDFPERKFILVGDSGEADLEVYTDVVLEHPGQILGVFIRDVTTPVQKAFFDQTVSNTPPDAMVSAKDSPKERPTLPTRPKSDPEAQAKEVDLIDFNDADSDPKTTKESSSHSEEMRQLDQNGKPPAPNKPNKPSSLRNFSTQSMSLTKRGRPSASDTEAQEDSKKKAPPPPKPRRSGTGAGSGSSAGAEKAESGPRPPFSSTRQNQGPSSQPSDAPPSFRRTNTSSSTVSSHLSRSDDDGYVASARRQIASAYNALPAIRSSSPTRAADQTGISSDRRPNPPLPPRRGISSYPAAAARWATGATGGDPAAGGDAGAPGASYDKKLEIWKRRWARSEEIMRQRGVVLRTWRVGSDVMEECVSLVKEELERIERSGS